MQGEVLVRGRDPGIPEQLSRLSRRGLGLPLSRLDSHASAPPECLISIWSRPYVSFARKSTLIGRISTSDTSDLCGYTQKTRRMRAIPAGGLPFSVKRTIVKTRRAARWRSCTGLLEYERGNEDSDNDASTCPSMAWSSARCGSHDGTSAVILPSPLGDCGALSHAIARMYHHTIATDETGQHLCRLRVAVPDLHHCGAGPSPHD